MDARLQGGRFAEAAAGAAQQALQRSRQEMARGLQFAATGSDAATGQLEGVADAVVGEVQNAAHQAATTAGRLDPASGQFRDLRPAAAAAVDPRPPPQFSVPSSEQPPQFIVPAAQQTGSRVGSVEGAPHAPVSPLPAATASSNGLSFDSSGRHSGAALSHMTESAVPTPPNATTLPLQTDGAPTASTLTSDGAASRDHSATASIGSATSPSPSAARDADAAGVAKPPPGTVASPEEVLHSPVEARAAAQVARSAGGAASALSVAQQAAETAPPVRKEATARRKLRQRRVPSSQLGRCVIDMEDTFHCHDLVSKCTVICKWQSPH